MAFSADMPVPTQPAPPPVNAMSVWCDGCLLDLDLAPLVRRGCLDSCRAVLFSCLPFRFAQENASVACHESAHLPCSPLPLLLTQEAFTPNFSCTPNTFCKSYILLFFSKRETHSVFFFISMMGGKVGGLELNICKSAFFFYFLTVPKKC